MTILAKSDRDITLPRHTQDVLVASDALFGTAEPTRLAGEWLRFFRLPPGEFAQFRANLTASAALHDLGKANRGFQDAVLHRGDQNIRHEHLSALIMALPAVDAWLRTSPLRIDWDIALSAVLTHHLKASVDEFAKRPAGNDFVLVLVKDPDFAVVLDIIGSSLQLLGGKPTVPERWHFSGGSGMLNIDTEAKAVKRRLCDFGDSLDDDKSRGRMLSAVRAALIAADAVGSTAERTRADIQNWIGSVFAREALTAEYVREKIIAPRIRQVGQKWRSWSTFQEQAAGLPERALLLAPCGAGKTLAAWRWIEARLVARPAARVVFLYPTRATATEGFRDYVSWAPEADADLMHGTAAYELSRLSENPRDRFFGRKFETEDRLYALGHWTKRIFSATVDQFLAFLQYGYGAVCMLPALADSVIVIDEVHSFDAGMFSAVCEFLREFNVPVLCMTATLPQNRIDELRRACLTVYNEKPDDLKTVADLPRYRVREVDRSAAEDRVREALAEGKRVLWVVNTVARCQAITAAFADGAYTVRCYHSRYRLKDRQARHAEAVAAVRPDQPASLTVTTQVCEMSLDLDADLLVTEVAPITSLIQRMGRCNRHRDARPEAGEVLIYKPEDDLPYGQPQLAGVPEFLRCATAKEWISQADLEAALAQAPRAVELPKACQFTSSGPYADGREDTLREIEEFAVQAVLDRDVPEFVRLSQERRPTDGLLVPVPRRHGRDPDQGMPKGLPKWLRVASASHYDAAVGFCDRPLSNGGSQ